MLPDVELQYRQHLTDVDLRLLATAGTVGLGEAMGSDAVERVVFGDRTPGSADPEHRQAAGWPGGELADASPFLVFAVAVHRSAARIEGAVFVEERFSRRLRIPVFDLDPLRELLDTPRRRYFLVELLASYTHVTSGATWERTARGWRRRRFSELDPVRLAGLLEVVDDTERPGVYRRLGDLALFLTGVFPDSRSALQIGPARTERLLRLSGVGRAHHATEEPEGRELLQALGARWYRQAAATARAVGTPTTASLSLVEEIGERFDEARRVLNLVTDWYLFPLRERWFGAG